MSDDSKIEENTKCTICGMKVSDHSWNNCKAFNILPEGSYQPIKIEGRKDDKDKLRYDLLPYSALEDITKVMTFGAIKYGDRNWESGISYSRVFAALLRHTLKWWTGEVRDPETNIHHLAHAGCCLLFLLHYEQYPGKYKQFNDKPKYYEVNGK